jgi:hypothetical protein
VFVPDFDGVFEDVVVLEGVPLPDFVWLGVTVVDADLDAVCDGVAVFVPDFDGVFDSVAVFEEVTEPDFVWLEVIVLDPDLLGVWVVVIVGVGVTANNRRPKVRYAGTLSNSL